MTRWLESERLLATLLLAPAVLLLGLFIAYPFIMGVWLSLSNTSVGNVGEFVTRDPITVDLNKPIARFKGIVAASYRKP